ncbi:FAD:protein FMN transferase [Actinacidiphila oryziradicis]|jgi:thiamine biosynthesis lipoprotein|uniref:FAD:protein FMN transferase n=1 Tax=Actinacidiphila oryziradicis TaxID=2571141 RepID=UPI0023F2EB57|nr:FAD:protein FMN transferase [Actinacidiphila oryziradicis]MCW2875071.1 thiamine biosynthesis protein [Actinacidiphila oryziradicis]
MAATASPADRRTAPRTAPAPLVGSVAFPALGTTAVLLVTDPAALAAARGALAAELASIDAACSRFRADSELSRANAAAGTPVEVGRLFAEALRVALRAAELTDGAVDPTVGSSVVALGYDRTFVSVRPEDFRPATVRRPSSRWQAIEWDPATRRLRLPAGTTLDLGATAKALAADRAARRAARVAGCGVLVNLGGDLSAAGEVPPGGWRVGIADDHAAPDPVPGPTVVVLGGGLATSGTAARTWRRAGRTLHHIVDPATGDIPLPVWRTVSVAAASCVDANTASTAAVVLGERAPGWLADRGLPARLVRTDGTVVAVGGWPAEGGPR